MPTEIIASSPDSEIVNSRIVNATRALVFRAWTEPTHLKNWWGPKGFTTTFNVFDLRPGGKWSFIMHGPDKGNYPNECEFIVIDNPNRIVWKHLSNPVFHVVAKFEEVSTNKTKIIFKMIFNSTEECNKVKAFAVDKNEENLDKLENELTKMMQKN